MYLSNKGDGRQIVSAEEKVAEITKRIDALERENAKLLEENVRANGLLDMAMKREARLMAILDAYHIHH